MAGDATSGYLSDGLELISSARWTGGHLFNVKQIADQIRHARQVPVHLSFFHSPHLFCGFNLSQILDANLGLSARPGFDKVGNRNR